MILRHIAAVSIMVLFVMFTLTSAQARHHHKRYHHRTFSSYSETIVGHASGCPGRAFCGCATSIKVFGHPVRELFLASNWFRFPHATPAAGMVAVRNHHVMYIMSVDGNGNATVYNPNSGGHLTRIQSGVSLAGYSVRNPHGARIASR